MVGTRLPVLVFAVLVLTACASGQSVRPLPVPYDVAIAPPAVDLTPELALFSGTWEGAWDGALLARLIVERIDSTSARVVYIWGDSPEGQFRAGWGRFSAKVLPGGKIQWGGETRFTFTLGKDRTSIHGEREQKPERWENTGIINVVTMQKIGGG